MDSLAPKAAFTLKDGRITLLDKDITDYVRVLAFELNEGGCWVSFQARAEVGDEGIEFDVPVANIKQYIGGETGPLSLTTGEVEQAVITAMANGAHDREAYGKALIGLLQSKGIEVITS